MRTMKSIAAIITRMIHQGKLADATSSVHHSNLKPIFADYNYYERNYFARLAICKRNI